MYENTPHSRWTNDSAGEQANNAQSSNGAFMEHAQHHKTKSTNNATQLPSNNGEISRTSPTIRGRACGEQRQTSNRIEDQPPDLHIDQPATSNLHGLRLSSDDIMYIPPCMIRHHPKLPTLLQQSTKAPPCTILTLRELDLQSIQNNINLRIDICHDHDLFFQPISGQKGDAKRIEGEKYWLSLAAEFRIYGHDAQNQCDICDYSPTTAKASFHPRLPTLFSNLKDIVQILVPATEHDEISQRIEVDFLMQQVQKGSLDIVRLSRWLASLLTLHCAPMRDPIADEVVDAVHDGIAHSDMQLLVAGIEKLFGLLEAMKLDIANHQIRAYRYRLIQDTVPFQQECFTRAIKTKQIQIESSQLWFQEARLLHKHQCTASDGVQSLHDFDGFIHAMVRLCNPDVKTIPTTFQYDHHRFVRLQEDLQDLVHIDLCLAVFNQLVSKLGQGVRKVSDVRQKLKSRIIFLTEDEEGNGGAIADHLESISIELTRAAFGLSMRTKSSSCLISEHDFERTYKSLLDVFRHEDTYQLITNEHLLILESRTAMYARAFNSMSTLEISNAQKRWAQVRAATNANKDLLLADWEDMARRLAHMGVLHWRVWADLCYLKPSQSLSPSGLTSTTHSEPSSTSSDESRHFPSSIGDASLMNTLPQPFTIPPPSQAELSSCNNKQRKGAYVKGVDIDCIGSSDDINTELYCDVDIDTEEDLSNSTETDVEN